MEIIVHCVHDMQSVLGRHRVSAKTLFLSKGPTKLTLFVFVVAWREEGVGWGCIKHSMAVTHLS